MSNRQKPTVEIQRQRAIRRLDVNDPRCCICGHDEPLSLEQHHIAGQKFDDVLAIVCRNCHRVLSANQREHPSEIGKRKGLLERIGHFLLGLADMLGQVAVRLKEFGLQLIEEARALCPSISEGKL